MTGTISTPEDLLARTAMKENLIDLINDLQRRVAKLEQGETVAKTLDEVASGIDEIRSMNFFSADSGYPDDSIYTGVFISDDGYIITGLTINVGGMNNGNLEFGLSAIDGTAIFAGGQGIIDSNGINLIGIRYGIRSYATDPGSANPRYGRLEMFYPDGSTIPALGIAFNDATDTTELVTNGDAESGDTTGWSGDLYHMFWIDTTWVNKSGSYCFKCRSYTYPDPIGYSLGGATNAYFAVSTGSQYQFTGKFGRDDLTVTAYVTLTWLQSDHVTVISTETIAIPAGYFCQTWDKTYTAPALAAYAQIEVIGGEATCTKYAYFDDISVKKLNFVKRLSFEPDLTYYDGTASCKMFPRSAFIPLYGFHAYNSSMVEFSMVPTVTSSQVLMGVYGKPATDDCNNGDRYQCSMFLEGGVDCYNFTFYGVRDDASGIFDLYIDGVCHATGYDLYHGSTDYDYHLYINNISIPGSGYHLIELVVNGKNGSSSDYRIMITFLSALRNTL